MGILYATFFMAGKCLLVALWALTRFPIHSAAVLLVVGELIYFAFRIYSDYLPLFFAEPEGSQPLSPLCPYKTIL